LYKAILGLVSFYVGGLLLFRVAVFSFLSFSRQLASWNLGQALVFGWPVAFQLLAGMFGD
jgi:hypothetical protein